MSKKERGEGKLSLFLFLAAIAIAVFVAIKWIPPRVNAYEFRDEMQRWNSDPDLKMRRADADTVVESLLKKADELHLPIKKENIQVRKDSDWYRIKVIFDVPIDLKVTTVRQHYEFTEPRD